jgi:hypothetical protein
VLRLVGGSGVVGAGDDVVSVDLDRLDGLGVDVDPVLRLTVALVPAPTRAFLGRPVALRTDAAAFDTGPWGEAIAVAYLGPPARRIDEHGRSFPLDLLAPPFLVEVKAGLVSNSVRAQQWRLTIGEPGPTEQAWLRTTTRDEKQAWHQAKADAIVQRKVAAQQLMEQQEGRTFTPLTVTMVLDPDRQLVDVYTFDGWHQRIGWTSPQAIRGYRGSYRWRRMRHEAHAAAVCRVPEEDGTVPTGDGDPAR